MDMPVPHAFQTVSSGLHRNKPHAAMRIALNGRILRHVQRTSASTSFTAVRATALNGNDVAVSLAALSLHRGIHTSPLAASVLRVSTRPFSPKIQARFINSVTDDEDDDSSDEIERVHPMEVREEEIQYLAALEEAYQGHKNWRVGKDIFDEFRSKDGEGLTPNIAAALIEVFAVRARSLECLEVLRYSRERGVRPRIHAYSTAIACCYRDGKYTQALRVFEIMRNDGFVPQHITYSRALSSAVKAKQHELVLEIFDDMVRNRIEPSIVTYNTILNACARQGDAHTALGVLRTIQHRGLELTQSSYYSLAICGGKTGSWELSEDAYNGLIASGYEPQMNVFNSVISAYARGKQWPKIISLYNEMPTEKKDMLQETALGAAVMAFAKTEDSNVRKKAAEVFEHHQSLGKELNVFAHNAVLLCYLETKEYSKLLALAQKMKENNLKWDTMTRQYVILAYIRRGEVSKAEQLLAQYSQHMNYTTVCYRELINYYGETRKDPIAACRFSMQMMHKNSRLSRQDWVSALTYALQAENKSVYWTFRKWLKVRGATVEMPSELLLAYDGDVKKKK